jgi:hypothetical protein
MLFHFPPKARATELAYWEQDRYRGEQSDSNPQRDPGGNPMSEFSGFDLPIR